MFVKDIMRRKSGTLKKNCFISHFRIIFFSYIFNKILRFYYERKTGPITLKSDYSFSLILQTPKKVFFFLRCILNKQTFLLFTKHFLFFANKESIYKIQTFHFYYFWWIVIYYTFFSYESFSHFKIQNNFKTCWSNLATLSFN